MSMIFCVEDDEAAANIAAYALESAGFGVKVFSEGQSFLRALQKEKPSLVLLDIMLPGGKDGISILKTMRSDTETENIPVIMTTAKGTEYDKVKGLDLGADDYLVKPFGMLEMVSRVRAVLRRTEKKHTEAETLSVPGIILNRTNHTVMVDGNPLELTLKEFSLLELFMAHPGRAFDRETLLTKIWNTDYAGDTRTVDVHIGTLRTKLGKYAGMIETVRGIGYRLEAV